MYYQMEPFGTMWICMGTMTVSTLLNIYRDQDKHPEPIEPREVMPKWDKTDIIEEQLAQIRPD